MQISLPRPAFQDVSLEENTFPEAHDTTYSVLTPRVTLVIFHHQLGYDQKGHNVEEMRQAVFSRDGERGRATV